VSQYIDKCLESFLIQDFHNLEIIVVDDGSTDGLKDHLKEYIIKGLIIYIYQENSGVSCARNTGLDIATGDYVYFCDPDDYVKPNFLESLSSNIERYKYDIISFNIERLTIDENDNIVSTEYEGYNGCEYKTNEDVFKNMFSKHFGTTQEELDETRHNGNILMSNHITTGTPLQCFNRKFLLENNLRFEPGMRLGEDRLFISKAVFYAISYLHLDAPLYVYMYRTTGCFSTITKKNPLDIVGIRMFWIEKYSELRRELTSKFSIDIFPYYILTCLIFMDNVISALSTGPYFSGCKKLHEFIALDDVQKAIKEVDLSKCSKKFKLRYWIYKLHLTYLLLFIYHIKYIMERK
jgi:glycosyltransferase involved in cell wall biosynthesis